MLRRKKTDVVIPQRPDLSRPSEIPPFVCRCVCLAICPTARFNAAELDTALQPRAYDVCRGRQEEVRGSTRNTVMFATTG